MPKSRKAPNQRIRNSLQPQVKKSPKVNNKSSKVNKPLKMSKLQTFQKFPELPLEVRQKIWRHALPGPRVLHVIREKSTTKYCVKPASYGGHQPSILSVSRESREEALHFLTPVFNAYWNLEIDAPYFEIKSNDDNAVTQLAQMTRAGMLRDFKNIAIDWNLWLWEMATYTMEFKVTFGDRFKGYKHPIKILNVLPKIKTCTFIPTDHTLQNDLVKPYVSWRLDQPTEETTLDPHWEAQEVYVLKDIEARRGELKRCDDLEIRVLAIHNREREYLPLRLMRRQQQCWEMDWFG